MRPVVEKWIKEFILIAILYAILLAPFIATLKFSQFHGDENAWLYCSKYFKLFFIDRDFHSNEWQDYYAIDQLPVGKYLVGLALVIGGHGNAIEKLRHLGPWGFLESGPWHTVNPYISSVELVEALYVVRLAMALFGGFTCFLVYWICKKIFDRKTGIFASLLLAYNPLMLFCSRKAMPDAPLLFFLTANVLIMIFFYDAIRQRKTLKTLVFAIILGINAALAMGTKFNGVLAAIIFASFCILIFSLKVYEYKRMPDILPGLAVNKSRVSKEMKTIGWSLCLSGIVALSLFILINPYLYGNPVHGMVTMIKHRMTTVHSEQEVSGLSLTTADQKVFFVIAMTLLPGKGVLLGNIFKIPIDLMLFVSGLILLLDTERKHLLKYRTVSPRSIILLWILITFAGTIAWIPMDWGRYYLPLVPCIVTMSGYILGRALSRSFQLIGLR